MKIGDKIKIKNDLSTGKKYKVFLNSSMVEYAGKEATIKGIIGESGSVEKYRIDVDDQYYSWTDDMFDAIEEKFKIGDNVIVIGGEFKGQRGKVCYLLDKEINKDYIGVDFPRYSKKRSNCCGSCEDGHGWFYTEEELELSASYNRDYEKKEVKLDELVKSFDEISKRTEEALKKEIKEKENKEINSLTDEVKRLTKEIKKKERFQDLMNEAVIDKAKDIAVDDLKEHLKEKLDTFIEEKYGILPKRIEVVTETSHKEIQGIFHKEFENICKLVKANIPIMLTGGAGAGKNFTLEQVAEALDLDFYFSNSVNQEYKLTGFIDANGTYHETEFYKAFTRGGMFFLDEIDASSPECLVILNSAIANKYFDFPTGRVKANENFRVVCAGNTYGTGADMIYVGRNVLDGATLDRFVVIPFDYDENVEKQLAYDTDLYEFIYNLRKAVNECQLRYVISMRALINAGKMLELGFDKQDILQNAIIKNMQIDDLNTIYNKLPSSAWKDELNKFMKKLGAE